MNAARFFLFALSPLLVMGAACAPQSTRPPTEASSEPQPSVTEEGVPALARAQPEMEPTEKSVAAADVPDATTTDPDKYAIVMENEQVRVLRYHDLPGEKTHQHRHPNSVLYALSSFKRRLHFPDGTSRERSFKSGDVMWVPAQTHIGENIGETNTEVLLVEMKTLPLESALEKP